MGLYSLQDGIPLLLLLFPGRRFRNLKEQASDGDAFVFVVIVVGMLILVVAVQIGEY